VATLYRTYSVWLALGKGGYLRLVFGIKQRGKHRFFIHIARMKGREHPQRDMVCSAESVPALSNVQASSKTSRIGSSLDVALIPHLQARKAAQEIVAIRAEVFALA
jgi:hypothetical protein